MRTGNGIGDRMTIGAFSALIFAMFAANAGVPSVEEAAFINGKKILLYVDRKAGIIVNHDCRKRDGTLNCHAVKALKKASLKNVMIEGGANPGAVLCGGLGGIVVLAVDSHKNETSYCRFPDGSVVASGSITFHARKNDQ